MSPDRTSWQKKIIIQLFNRESPRDKQHRACSRAMWEIMRNEGRISKSKRPLWTFANKMYVRRAILANFHGLDVSSLSNKVIYMGRVLYPLVRSSATSR